MRKKGERILLVAGKPSGYLSKWDITNDLSLAERKLEVSFREIPKSRLLENYTFLAENERVEAFRLAEKLIQGALKIETQVPKEEVEKATRLYVVMRRILKEDIGDAVTIVCGKWAEKDLPVPCVALMLFQEEGVPAACQGDIDALLTMILLKRATGLPTFMGGAIKTRGRLGISHCVLPRTMLGPNTEFQPYYISDYHGRKKSPTIGTIIPVGQKVTIARLTQNLERLLLATGKVRSCRDLQSRCRNTVIIEVPDREHILRAVKGIQNHYVLACGDHVRKMMKLAENSGIRVVNLNSDIDLS